jgi:hypothetical protein
VKNVAIDTLVEWNGFALYNSKGKPSYFTGLPELNEAGVRVCDFVPVLNYHVNIIINEVPNMRSHFNCH